MNLRKYEGRWLRFDYPDFLKIKRGESGWYAEAPKGRTTLQINVDPEPAAAEGFARLIRNPYYTKTGGAKIDREGAFKTARGLEGYERLARLVNPIGQISTHWWAIEARS